MHALLYRGLKKVQPTRYRGYRGKKGTIYWGYAAIVPKKADFMGSKGGTILALKDPILNRVIRWDFGGFN